VSGKVVICAINGELTVKRLERVNDQWQLKAENPAYANIIIHDDLELVIWVEVSSLYDLKGNNNNIFQQKNS
jgi:DNA polymerase V